MELSRQMLLLTAENYGSYYLHITKVYFGANIAILFVTTQVGLPYSYYDETIAA